MHRLRGSEYRNSVRDLLGIDTAAPVPDVERPYDAIIKDAAPWIAAASSVAQQALAQGEPQPPFDCVPAEPLVVDRSCALAIVDGFGLRAFRRPLLDQERTAFLRVFDDLSEADGTHMALEQTLRALLLSPAFLFHVELSDNPDGSEPERLDSYALAARLSFALWRTTPDPALLEAASVGLLEDSALTAAHDRLAGSERIRELADGLNDVWLGLEQLTTHAVDANVFPNFTYPDRLLALDAQREFLRSFLKPAQPLRQLLTLQTGERTGLLGQAALLTLTSSAGRTSPSRRGAFVLDKLLCQPTPAAPPNSSEALGVDYPPGQSERETVEILTLAPSCQACHRVIDPMGFALDQYDALGAPRSIDSQGYPIDASVSLPEELFPDGVSVTGLRELSQELAASPLFSSCGVQQIASYLIQRELTEATDPELVARLRQAFDADGSLEAVARSVVMSDQFRYRRAP